MRRKHVLQPRVRPRIGADVEDQALPTSLACRVSRQR
jgi:hypothetical protein